MNEKSSLCGEQDPDGNMQRSLLPTDPGQDNPASESNDFASPIVASDIGRGQGRSDGGISSIAVLSPRS
jgi:hypothetical protein